MGWDDVLKTGGGVVGGLIGNYFGYPGVGAALGRAGGGLATGEDSGSLVKNSAMAYGLGNAAEAGMNSYALDTNFVDELGSSFSPAMSMFSSGGGGGGASTTPGGGLMGGLSMGGSNLLPLMIGGGLLSDWIAGGQKKNQEEEYNQNVEKNLAEYLSKTTWNPEMRTSYAKGLGGQYNDLLTGASNRTAAVGADAGRGGGFFNNKLAAGRNAANKAVADALGKTYQPATTDPSVYTSLAKAQTSPLPASNTFLTGLGETAGKWPYLALLNQGRR